MNLPLDIRFYHSHVPNINGNPYPTAFARPEFDLILRRIAIKLWDNGINLGKMDQLYINLTDSEVEKGFDRSRRKIYGSGSRCMMVEVQVSPEFFKKLGSIEVERKLLLLLAKTLQVRARIKKQDEAKTVFLVREAIEQGESMRWTHKKKRTATREARLFLQLLDNGLYRPTLQVCDKENHVLLEEVLEDRRDLLLFKDIQLTAKRVSVVFPSNWNDFMPPIAFDIPRPPQPQKAKGQNEEES